MSKWVKIAVILFSALFIFSCAKAQLAAQRELEKARAEEAQLKQSQIPDNMQQNYRIQLKKAENAFNDKDYENSQKYSAAACAYAQTVVAEYEKLGTELDLRLKNLHRVITNEAFPRKLVVDSYFDALEAYEKKEYKTAAQILDKAERTQKLEGSLTKRTSVVIRADEDYYIKYKFISAYEKVEDNSLAGNVILKLYEDGEAVFITSIWKDRSLRIVKIAVQTPNGKIEGWVEGRFVR